MSPRWSLPRQLHRTVDRLDRAARPLIRRSPAAEKAWIRMLDGIVALQSDRRYMTRNILPTIAAAGFRKVLFVGTRGYTAAYGKMFDGTGTEFWTSDIDPDAARYGAPGRHVTCDVGEIDRHFPAGTFDLVILNGILGWGVDSRVAMRGVFRALNRTLAPGGLLLVGWNADRLADPATLPFVEALFQPTGFGHLPGRKAFSDVTHVYRWFRKLDPSAG